VPEQPEKVLLQEQPTGQHFCPQLSVCPKTGEPEIELSPIGAQIASRLRSRLASGACTCSRRDCLEDFARNDTGQQRLLHFQEAHATASSCVRTRNALFYQLVRESYTPPRGDRQHRGEWHLFGTPMAQTCWMNLVACGKERLLLNQRHSVQGHALAPEDGRESQHISELS